MTNQASGDGLRDLIIKTMRYANSVTPHKLNEPIDPFVDGAIDFAVDEMEDIIRTEKLKLLAGVRERVIGENDRGTITHPDSPSYGEPYESTMADKNEQRIALNKLEAELWQEKSR